MEKIGIRMMVGGIAGALLGNLVGTHLELREVKKNVYLAQEYNAQLLGQLSVNFEVDHLIVDVEGSSFEFTSHSEIDGSQTCEGEFKVVNDAAQAVDSVACTTINKITN